jgi:hypothetical protein
VGSQKAKNAVLLASARHGEAAVLNGFWKQVTEGRQENEYSLHWPHVMYGMSD